MNTNKGALNTAINNLSSICPKGREEVRALVETITGVRLKEEEPLEIKHLGIYGNDEEPDKIFLIKKLDLNQWVVVWNQAEVSWSTYIARNIGTGFLKDFHTKEELQKILTNIKYKLQGTISFVKQ